MYLLWGNKQKALKKHYKELDRDCPKCDNKKSIAVPVIKYLHFFFIPMFVYKQRVSFICSHCKYNYQEKTKESSLQEMFSLKKIWGYNFGSLAFVSMILLSIIIGMINSVLA